MQNLNFDEMEQDMENELEMEPTDQMEMPEEDLSFMDKIQEPAFTSSIISSKKARKTIKRNLQYLERFTGEKYNLL